jgi:hypothetical protein
MISSFVSPIIDVVLASSILGSYDKFMRKQTSGKDSCGGMYVSLYRVIIMYNEAFLCGVGCEHEAQIPRA